jgi:hypothetical protein
MKIGPSFELRAAPDKPYIGSDHPLFLSGHNNVRSAQSYAWVHHRTKPAYTSNVCQFSIGELKSYITGFQVSRGQGAGPLSRRGGVSVPALQFSFAVGCPG